MAKKKQNPVANGQVSLTEKYEPLLEVLGRMIHNKGALVSAIDWATTLLDNAEELVGIPGSKLVERTIKMRDLSRQGKVPDQKEHYTTYANRIRDLLVASGKVQRRYVPVVVNVTKMAVSYVTKEPISKELAITLVDANIQNDLTRLHNTLCSYLQQIRPTDKTMDILVERDFYGAMETAIKSTWIALLDQYWGELEPKS
jgi:hypothetical protein